MYRRCYAHRGRVFKEGGNESWFNLVKFSWEVKEDENWSFCTVVTSCLKLAKASLAPRAGESGALWAIRRWWDEDSGSCLLRWRAGMEWNRAKSGLQGWLEIFVPFCFDLFLRWMRPASVQKTRESSGEVFKIQERGYSEKPILEKWKVDRILSICKDSPRLRGGGRERKKQNKTKTFNFIKRGVRMELDCMFQFFCQRFPTPTVKGENAGGGFYFWFLCIWQIKENTVSSEASGVPFFASCALCPHVMERFVVWQ